MSHLSQHSAPPPPVGDQYEFDNITITTKNQRGGAQPTKSINPPILSFEKKCLYVGKSGNWRVTFKDLEEVEQSTIERDVYDYQQHGVGRHQQQQQRGRHQHRGSSSSSSETIILKLSSRKITVQCTARKGTTARAAHRLASFIDGLKNAHRRVKIKNNGKDPYAFEENNNSKAAGGGSFGGRHSRSAVVSSKRMYGQQQQQQRGGAVRKQVTVTPHAQQQSSSSMSSSSLLYMSPTKKRLTSGAFQSPPRRRSTSIGGGGANSSADQQYAHYDPARYSSTLKKKCTTNSTNNNNNTANKSSSSNNDAIDNSDNVTITGNVVHEPEPSPAARKLNLPPKSPRNATPTKLRFLGRGDADGGAGGIDDDDDVVGLGIVGGKKKKKKVLLRSITNQLNGISGGHIQLRKMIIDDDDDGGDEVGLGVGEEGAGESNTPKRRRLQKAGGGGIGKSNEDGNDSDVEFGDGSDVEAKQPASSCKKKLKLSIEDDDDDVEEKEAGVSSEKEASKKAASSTSPSSIVDTVLAPSSSSTATENIPIIKKGSIHSFFTKKPSSKSSSSTTTTTKNKTSAKTTKRSSSPSATTTADTYGATIILSTPSKKKKARSENSNKSSTSLPLTPPHQCTDYSKPTPVTKQMQRKSQYFSTVGNATTGGSTLKYSSDEEEQQQQQEEEEFDFQNYESGYYNDETTDAAAEKTAYEQMGGGNNTARRKAYGRLGESRLASRRIGISRPTAPPPNQRLNFNKYKASSSSATAMSSKRGLNFGSSNYASPSTADVALGSGRRDEIPTLVPMEDDDDADNKNNDKNQPSAKKKKPSPSPSSTSGIAVPGIQNLGNTCYLSASLQTLFSIPQFLSDLYITYEAQSSAMSSSSDDCKKKMPLTRALLEVATAIGVLSEEDAPLISPEVARSKLLSSKAANPAALKRQMDVLTDKFAGYEQRDAHEFLSDLVDFLHDELAASPPPAAAAAADETSSSAEGTAVGQGDEKTSLYSADENMNPNESPVKVGEEKGVIKSNEAATSVQHDHGVLPTDDYFHMNVRVCLECDSCGYSRSKDEMYRHLSVDVGEDSELDKCTVERGLRQFFQPEKRELNCERCNIGKTATQTMEIISCPKALLLHFKRFIVTQEMKGSANGGVDNSDGKENKVAPSPRMEMVLRKNKAKIPLEESLSINQFVGKNGDCPSGKYHLRGVVHHVGSTAFSGHYTTCAKRRTIDQQGSGVKKSNSAAAPDNEEQWVFFDDRVGMKKDMGYVTGSERNQRNCYMALYELK